MSKSLLPSQKDPKQLLSQGTLPSKTGTEIPLLLHHPIQLLPAFNHLKCQVFANFAMETSYSNYTEYPELSRSVNPSLHLPCFLQVLLLPLALLLHTNPTWCLPANLGQSALCSVWASISTANGPQMLRQCKQEAKQQEVAS